MLRLFAKLNEFAFRCCNMLCVDPSFPASSRPSKQASTPTPPRRAYPLISTIILGRRLGSTRKTYWMEPRASRHAGWSLPHPRSQGTLLRAHRCGRPASSRRRTPPPSPHPSDSDPVPAAGDRGKRVRKEGEVRAQSCPRRSLLRLSTSAVRVGCPRRLSASAVRVGCPRRLSASAVLPT